jgi:hypothetical protein
MAKYFSYVVDHDYGYAPCPFGGVCTLAKCKYGSIKCKSGTRRNIVELAEEGDWIAGTGGVDLDKSAGHGKLIYAMRVDEKITLREYCEGNHQDEECVIHPFERESKAVVLHRQAKHFVKRGAVVPRLG